MIWVFVAFCAALIGVCVLTVMWAMGDGYHRGYAQGWFDHEFDREWDDSPR